MFRTHHSSFRASAKIALFLVAIYFISAPTHAQLAPAAPAKAEPFAGDEQSIVPDLDLHGVSLEDMIAILQKADPNFKALVFVDNGAISPRITLKVKGASRQQILELVTMRNPNIEMILIRGGPAIIHTFQVARRDARAVVDAPPYVKIYALSAAIGRLAHAEPDRDAKPISQKEGLDRVLSLIKAAVATQEAADDSPVSLQVHADTQTLIIREQRLSIALLKTRWAPENRVGASERELQAGKENLAAMNEQFNRREAALRDMVDQLKKSEEAHIKDILEKTQQIERLKIRVEDFEKRVQKP